MSTWWLYFRGVPLDPEARVPRASSPYDHVRGELRRLTQPLKFNFQELRANGMLCVPSGPTHTGMFNVPIDAHVVYTTLPPASSAHGSRPRLVAADYDTSSDDTLRATSAWSGSGSSRRPPISTAEHSSDDEVSLVPTECYISEELLDEPVVDAPSPRDDMTADSEDDPEGKLFNVWVRRVNIDGQPTPRASILRLTLERGDTTIQLRVSIRRRLKLHPNRITLMCSDDNTPLPVDIDIWGVRKKIALAVDYGRRESDEADHLAPNCACDAGSALAGEGPAVTTRLVASDYDASLDTDPLNSGSDGDAVQHFREDTEDSSAVHDSLCSSPHSHSAAANGNALDCDADSEGHSPVILRSGAGKLRAPRYT
eukprot:2028532-Amphidinium_carterae.4